MTRRLSLKQRIMLFLIPLMLAVAGTSGVIVLQYYQTWQKALSLKTSIDFSMTTSAMIHEMQTERGKSSDYLNGVIKKEELDVQRNILNEKVKNVEAMLSRLDKDQSEASKKLINDLTETRKYVDNAGQSPEAGRRYGEIIDRSVRLQVERARSYPLNGLESMLISQSIFEASTENMGKLRAAVSTILGKDIPIDQDTETKLGIFKSGIVSNLRSPGLAITDDTRKKTDQIMASEQWKSIENIINIIGQKAHAGKYEQDPKLFFSNITNIINNLYGLISDEAKHVDNTITEVISESRNRFWFYLTSMVIGLALILTFSMKTVADIFQELESLSSTLSKAATHTASISGDMSNSANSLASGATEQAAALQETVASLEEVRAMVSKNSDNAQQAKTVATQSAEGARKGRETMSELVETINQIQKSNEAIQAQVETSNNELTEITKVIGEIASKTKVINEIVFQTKLLSFNASVEAARAGEHGKGFAVVADEVGNLAQMSGNASKEISQLLDSSIQKVEMIVRNSKSKVTALMNSGKEKVSLGTQCAKRCDNVLDEVLKGAEEMNIMVAEIATASHEQSQGVDEIAKAMNQLETVTQSNSAASSQVSSVANELNENAKKMEEQVINLMRLTRGRNAKAEIASQPEKSPVPNNVIHLVRPEPTVTNETVEPTVTPYLKAAGAENIPSENDPRFEEV